MRRGTYFKERVVPEATVETPETGTEPTCVHHWVIETPSGANSLGTCRICGEQREFQNYVSDFVWEGDSTESYGSGGWRKPVKELVRPAGDEESLSGRATLSDEIVA